MALAFSIFKMERYILDIFTRAKLTDKEGDYSKMGIATLVNGEMAQALDREATTTPMVADTKVIC